MKGNPKLKEKFACWHQLFVDYLKRDWKLLLLWVLGMVAFCGGFVPAFKEIAKGSGLLGMFETMRNPAMIAIVGPTPIKHAQNYTIGAMYAQEMLLFCGLFAMIISILFVINHTRKEEDLGQQELIRSMRVGRQANSLAVTIEVILTNLVLGVLTTELMLSFQLDSIDVTGSVIFGSSLALAGILGAVLALIFAQIMPTAGGATGASFTVIGILYMLRAATDVSALKFSYFNPLGWTYLTAPFTKNRGDLLGWGLLFSLILLIIAFIL